MQTLRAERSKSEAGDRDQSSNRPGKEARELGSLLPKIESRGRPLRPRSNRGVKNRGGLIAYRLKTAENCDIVRLMRAVEELSTSDCSRRSSNTVQP
jgi:hypothetical protein